MVVSVYENFDSPYEISLLLSDYFTASMTTIAAAAAATWLIHSSCWCLLLKYILVWAVTKKMA